MPAKCVEANGPSGSDAETPIKNPSSGSGLCATCVDTGTCTFPRRESEPVLFCEEFDGGEQNTVGAPVEVVAPSATVRAQAMCKTEPSAKLRGLCGTCDKRATCMFPKAEGGVWHCEEFE